MMSAQRRRRMVFVGTLMGVPGVLVVLYTASRLATLAAISGHDLFWRLVSAMMVVVLVLGLVMLASGINVVQAALRGRTPAWPEMHW
jgi:uncharacterized membrane protein HdeD (DUF308 family)